MRYYEYRHNATKGIPLANEATKIPAFAKEAYWLKANLLQNAGKYPVDKSFGSSRKYTQFED